MNWGQNDGCVHDVEESITKIEQQILFQMTTPMKIEVGRDKLRQWWLLGAGHRSDEINPTLNENKDNNFKNPDFKLSS